VIVIPQTARLETELGMVSQGDCFIFNSRLHLRCNMDGVVFPRIPVVEFATGNIKILRTTDKVMPAIVGDLYYSEKIR
jgi:hypothetical protein